MGRIRSDSLRRVSAKIEPLAWEGARALIATHLDRYEHWNEAKQVAYVSVLHVGKYLSHLARKRDAVNFRLERKKVSRDRSQEDPSWHLQDQLMTY